ncbi:MAG: YlxR family protein [Dehalococcoidia bacterium]
MTSSSTRRSAGPRPRRVPQRTCIGCRATSAKRGFVRIVRTAEGRIEVDLTGKKPGRGAYLCAQRSCWETALKREQIARALRTPLLSEDRMVLAEYSAALPAAAPDHPAGES